jgi:hypothetical protein
VIVGSRPLQDSGSMSTYTKRAVLAASITVYCDVIARRRPAEPGAGLEAALLRRVCRRKLSG